jgi:hypothetical protein
MIVSLFQKIKGIIFLLKISKFNIFENFDYEENHDFSKIQKLCEGKKIALVGNSPKLVLKKTNIDTYDVVIRINLLPMDKHKHLVGKRCDILMLSTGPINLINKNFIKLYLTNKNRHFTKYGRGEVVHYPLEWWNKLHNLLGFRPSSGAMSIHFLTELLKDTDITLFGFEHVNTTWWEGKIYQKNNPHNYKAEKKFFSSLLSNKIKYSK